MRFSLHAEVAAAVHHQGVELDEGARVEQQLDALAGGELALPVLALDALRAAPHLGGAQPLQQLAELGILELGCHRSAITRFAIASRDRRTRWPLAATERDRRLPSSQRFVAAAVSGRRPVEQSRQVQLTGLDTAAVARALGQIAERDDDVADAFFERREQIELALGGKGAGVRVVREEGLAARLVRGGRTWLASRDALDGRALGEALRQVARVQPRAALPEPALATPPWEDPRQAAPELAAFGRAVERAIHTHHAAFPLRLTVRRHRRAVQVVGPRLVPAPEGEEFWSLAAELPWSRHGTLLGSLGRDAAEHVAAALVGMLPGPRRGLARGRARRGGARAGRSGGAPPRGGGARSRGRHAGPGGQPGGGDRRASRPGEPARARRPDRRRRRACGARPTTRACRCCAAGCCAAARSSSRSPTRSGRRARRRWRRAPRGAARATCRRRRARTHLELLAGEQREAELMAAAEGGLYLPEAARGRLDPATGAFVLRLPFGQRVRGGEPAEAVGPCSLVGRLGDLLRQVRGVGREARAGGRRLVRQGRPEAAGLGHHAGAAARRRRGGCLVSEAILDETLAALGRAGLDEAEVYWKRGRARRVELGEHDGAAVVTQEEGWAVRAGDRRGSFFCAATGAPRADLQWPEPGGQPLHLYAPPSPAAAAPPNGGADGALLTEAEAPALLEAIAQGVAAELPGSGLRRALLEEGASESRLRSSRGVDAAWTSRAATLRLEAVGRGRRRRPSWSSSPSARRRRSGRRSSPAAWPIGCWWSRAARPRTAIAASSCSRRRSPPGCWRRSCRSSSDRRRRPAWRRCATGAAASDRRRCTVIDDGALAGGVLAAPVDGEGVPTREVVLVEEGSFRQPLLTWREAQPPQTLPLRLQPPRELEGRAEPRPHAPLRAPRSAARGGGPARRRGARLLPAGRHRRGADRARPGPLRDAGVRLRGPVGPGHGAGRRGGAGRHGLRAPARRPGGRPRPRLPAARRHDRRADALRDRARDPAPGD